MLPPPVRYVVPAASTNCGLETCWEATGLPPSVPPWLTNHTKTCMLRSRAAAGRLVQLQRVQHGRSTDRPRPVHCSREVEAAA